MKKNQSVRYCLHLFCLLIFIVAANQSMAQPYPIGHRQTTFTDANRNNRSIPCEVYYPATIAGDNVPPVQAQFPLLVFGHGFVMTWSAYDIYWNNLVPRGYIMVFPTTESGFSPSHSNFAQDLAFLCSFMQTENTNPSSPYFGIVDSTSAVMGHSMGGGASFLAKQFNPGITAMAVMAPAITNPPYAPLNNESNLPCLVFAGSNDCVTPPSVHQLPLYDSLFSDAKTYLSITGGDHCQFASNNLNCSLGQLSCSPQASISASAQQSTVFSLLNPWLDFYLKGQCAQGDLFQDLLNAGSGISSAQNNELSCISSGTSALKKEKKISIYHTSDKVIAHVDAQLIGRPFMLFNLFGQMVASGIFQSSGNHYILENAVNGFYILQVEDSSLPFVRMQSESK
ncbi:MAG: alpha/beta hydrolase family protein [Bacteroidota bacterium]